MGPRALIAFAVLVAAGCGPRPRVQSARARREAGRTVVEVSVANSGGSGEVSVTVRLRDRATGVAYSKEDGLPMEAGRAGVASIELAVPDGDYEVSAQAEYPP